MDEKEMHLRLGEIVLGLNGVAALLNALGCQYTSTSGTLSDTENELAHLTVEKLLRRHIEALNSFCEEVKA